MSKYKRDVLNRLYQIGGADLALRYADLAESSWSDLDKTDYEIKVISLHFYNGGAIGPSTDERKFSEKFAKQDAQYIYFQVKLSNPWRYINYSFILTARYYNQENRVIAEVEDKIVTQPEWQTFFHHGGWGWEIPGYWRPGVYRVDIAINHQHRYSDNFTIFEASTQPDLTSHLLDRHQSIFDPLNNGLSNVFSELVNNEPFLPTHQNNSRSTGLGLDGWIEKLSKNDSARRITANKIPENDLDKFRCLTSIDHRYLAASIKARPGSANEHVIEELLEIAADYQCLLDGPMPKYDLFYSQNDLLGKLADTYAALARAYDLLNDSDQARQYYSTASKRYQALGKQNEAEQCQADLENLEDDQVGDVDKKIERLNQRLANIEQDSVEHAEILVDLGGIYCQNGDDFEAEKLLTQAEKILDRLNGDPSGEQIANALSHTFLSLSQGTFHNGLGDIQSVLKINNLYRVLYVLLARIYQDSDQDKARSYRAKAAQRDNRENNDAFSRAMLTRVEDLFKTR